MVRKKTSATLLQALSRSQSGDVEGALVLLEASEESEADAQGLRFLLLMKLGRSDEALAVANATVPHVKEQPLLCSTWLLRRGMLLLEQDKPLEALADLNQVLRLDASPDHGDQARKALLRLAESGRIQ